MKKIILAGACLAAFAAASMFCAARKPFWLDETYGFEMMHARGWGEMILRGAPGQSSPAPLYYLLGKAGQPLSARLEAAGVPARIFTRWTALAPVLFGSAAICLSQPPGLVWGFLFSKSAFVQSFEARPYALWLALSFLLLVKLLGRPSGYGWMLLCLMLGMTATVSLFQLAAVAVCLIIAQRVFERPSESPAATFGPIAAGIVVALYYSFYAGRWGYTGPQWGTWRDFSLAFVRQAATLIGASVLAIEARREGHREEWTVYMTILAWFAMSPFLYVLTRSRGYFFHERQYIYWTASSVVVLWGIGRSLFADGLPSWREYRNPRKAFTLVLFLFCLDRVGPHHALWRLIEAVRAG
jgi:hypothetical protein